MGNAEAIFRSPLTWGSGMVDFLVRRGPVPSDEVCTAVRNIHTLNGVYSWLAAYQDATPAGRKRMEREALAVAAWGT